ncbi:hypothetical protein CEW46_29150 [Bacillus cereus]|nr:hypothetical protein CEW46_29150 [Bacillus cereus]
MKKVIVHYFKPSGKWYTEESVMISEELNGYQALHEELPKHHRLKDMRMLVMDGDETKQPYIVPHIYDPII